VSFLAPFFLSLAVLAGVPLLVHLLRRRVTRRVDFPAVRFLLQTEREHDRERLVRNRLLLLLRLLAVLALVAAVARPMARLVGSGHPPMAVAIVLDQSMSTRAVVEGRTVFSRLQEAARATVSSLTPDDRGWLVTSEGQVVAGDAAALTAAIDAQLPAAGRGDLPGALRRARTLLDAGRPRTPVLLVLTDGQRSALAPEPEPLALGDVALVVHVPDVTTPANRAVHDVAMDPTRWVPAGRLSMRLSGPDSLAWRVLLGTRTLARGTADAAPFAEPVRVEVAGQAVDTGWLAGRVELEADEFPGDDVRHFVVRAAPPPAVAVRRSAGPFTAAAVEALVDDARLRRASAADRVLVVITGAAEEAAAPAVRVAPDDPLQVVAANRALERAGVPWRYGAPLRDTVAVRDLTSPVGDAARGPEAPSLAGATVTVRYRLTRVPPTGGADSGRVLATAGGLPWIVAGTGYVLVGSPLALSATNAPVQAAFVPWLRDLLTLRLSDEGAVAAASPGDTITLPFEIDALVGPEGDRLPGGSVDLVVPATPGVYRLTRADRVVGALVVNPETEESNVQGRGEAVWQEPFTEGRALLVSASASVSSAVFDRAGGRSIVWPLVLLALVALALEALLARGVFGARTDRP
jgi:hypothetical protein